MLVTAGHGDASARPACITDDTGTEVCVEVPKRVVSLYGAFTELIWELGVGDRLVARTKNDTTIEDVRSLAIRLRPGVLDDLGLVDALEWYTSDFERRSQIPCVFKPNPVPVIDETLATAAYRIAQEALTNVARHARANQAEVDLKIEAGQLVLMVSDDGRGFEAASAEELEGLGLAGMRERATLVGGSLDVQSQPQKGTRVSFRVPIDGQAGH